MIKIDFNLYKKIIAINLYDTYAISSSLYKSVLEPPVLKANSHVIEISVMILRYHSCSSYQND